MITLSIVSVIEFALNVISIFYRMIQVMRMYSTVQLRKENAYACYIATAAYVRKCLIISSTACGYIQHIAIIMTPHAHVL